VTLLQESRRLIDVPVTGDGLTADEITVSVVKASSPGQFYAVHDYTNGIARFLVGPGSEIGMLAAGLNRMYVHIEGMDPEDPKEPAGSIWVEGTDPSAGDTVSGGDIDGGGPDSFPDGDPA
jgi:hypothetical protein